MAAVTAACATFDSSMVTVLVAFSPVRCSVASATAASRSEMAAARSAISWVSFASRAVSSSTFAARSETSAESDVRVASLVASSSSHQPLWSASELASSMSLTRRSLIIFLTLPKGSSPTRSATVASMRLSRDAALEVSRATTFCCSAEIGVPLRSWARAAGLCSRAAGRCFSPAPETAPLEMISIAFWIASISCPRRTARLSKSVDFWLHMAVVSRRYVSSDSLDALDSARSPLASSASWILCAFSCVFSETWPSAYLTSSAHFCIIIS
mmetsp:Transcript_6768/g.18206  ORF Transcript_6768/g.18206 Transcript_6768/m.18206 type:complete len:270 (-) Transcript_6768:703-1512(-)